MVKLISVKSFSDNRFTLRTYPQVERFSEYGGKMLKRQVC